MRATCPICGNEFETKTWGAKYCSGRCRTAAHRRRAQVPRIELRNPPSDPALLEAVENILSIEHEFAMLAVCSPPCVAVICDRVCCKILAGLSDVGML